jgi:NAD(P)H-nitrite reductase large subunit
MDDFVLNIETAAGDEPALAQTLTCRCEEILDIEVIAAIVAGARTVDDVKRRTRAGMGACQGVYCMPTIAAIVSQATETAIDRLAPMTARPPVRPVPLEALATLHEQSHNADEADSRT